MMMMMEDSTYLAGALFPVVFFDGEREIDLGTVVISPAMNFHGFRSIISQTIGISYHQLTIYFERIIVPFHHPYHHRGPRHPVTNKFNFSAAMSESTSAFFRVVLKRSRRHRRRRQKSEMDNIVLLRREPSSDMEREKERYLMSMNLNSDVYSDLSTYGYGGGFGLSSDDGATSSSCEASSDKAVCDVCLHYSETQTAPFHWCKNDAVTSPFRSHAGPVGPVLPKSRFVESEYT